MTRNEVLAKQVNMTAPHPNTRAFRKLLDGIFMGGNRMAGKSRLVFAGLALFVASGVAGEAADARLETFQVFVNGRIPIKEAVVSRQVLKADGTMLNQEWWRFGSQERTWFVERLMPDPKDRSKLVQRPHAGVVGASYSNLWTVSDHDIHLVGKNVAHGSGPESNGAFSRELMYYALSLGLPRKPIQQAISESPIEWKGATFSTEVVSEHGTNGSALATARITGKLTLDTDSIPTSAEIPAIGDVASCTVKYDYTNSNPALPSVFTIKYRERAYRFEFLSLQLGSNDLAATDGYVPAMFADMKIGRHVTVWTNDLAYSLIDGKVTPAFSDPAPRLGERPPELHGTVWFNTPRALTLRELRGKVVLLEFWATWCPPCVEALPHIQAQYAKFVSRGLVVIGIHTGWGTEKGLNAFLLQHNVTFPVVVDSDVAIADAHTGRTSRSYVLDGRPSYALVDRQGNLVWKSTQGARPNESQIEELLGR